MLGLGLGSGFGLGLVKVLLGRLVEARLVPNVTQLTNQQQCKILIVIKCGQLKGRLTWVFLYILLLLYSPFSKTISLTAHGARTRTRAQTHTRTRAHVPCCLHVRSVSRWQVWRRTKADQVEWWLDSVPEEPILPVVKITVEPIASRAYWRIIHAAQMSAS